MKTHISAQKPVRRSVMLRWALVLASAIILLALLQSTSFRRFFLPGNKDVTEAAVAELVESIQQGDRFDDVITTFCRQIIENGE